MHLRLILATAILGATTLLHTIGGEITVHTPLLALANTAEMGLYVTLLWHFITFFLAFGTVSLVMVLYWPQRWASLALGTGILCLGMGAMFFGLGMLRLGSVWIAPQWVLLLPVAGLILWPTRGARPTA